MVQLSLSGRGHRVGLLALFATPVIGAESGKANLPLGDVPLPSNACAWSGTTSRTTSRISGSHAVGATALPQILSLRAGVTPHPYARTHPGNRRRSIAATSEGNHHDRHQQPGRYPGPCTGSTDLLTSEDNASVIVLGDLNDEVEAATTQILNGPTGSEIGTGGFNQPDHGDRQRLWNLAPRIPEAQRFSRIYRGRKELIDHIFVSHALVGTIAQDHVTTDAAGRTPSIKEGIMRR